MYDDRVTSQTDGMKKGDFLAKVIRSDLPIIIDAHALATAREYDVWKAR